MLLEQEKLIDELRKALEKEQEAQAEHSNELDAQRERIQELEAQLAHLKRCLFGRRSERIRFSQS